MQPHATTNRDVKSDREKILSDVNPDDFAWAVPVMRAGYAGRGLVYLVVASVSLWSIMHGGDAEGTKSAMESITGVFGAIVVALIAAGMFSYAIWRVVDSIWDLEAYGTSAKGIVARIGMMVTGTIHAGIGVLAVTALGLLSSGSESQTMLREAVQSPAGVWLVGIAGALTIATGFYYLYKAKAEAYREHLQANQFTTNWRHLLRIGVAAQGFSVIIIGGLILYAALSSDTSQTGGMGSAFEWLGAQAYGRVLVAVLCVGLLGFSLFCFVNAVYRIVPKASDGSVQSLATKMRQSAEKAVS